MHKVLIVSANPFSKSSNNGKTLESLFANFPKENLSQLFFTYSKNLDFDYCDNYFYLPDSIILHNLLSLKKQYGYVIGRKSINKKPVNNSFVSFFRRYFNSNNGFLNSNFLRDILWKFNDISKNRKLKEWIRLHSPDIIFFHAGGARFSYDIVGYISDVFEIPIFVYYTDDYILNPEYRSILQKLQHKRMYKFYPAMVERAKGCFAIGEMMATEYSKFFKKNFFPIMNQADFDKDGEINQDRNSSKEIISINYFGGLHLQRWKSIVRLGVIINKIALCNNLNIVVNIYTATHCTKDMFEQFERSKVNYRGILRGKELRDAQLNSDILLHVESDDVYYRSLTKLSVSTKLPEYLSTRNCILGFGPPEVASMRLLVDNNIGYYVNSGEDDIEVMNKLELLLADIELRKNIADRGYKYVCENLNPNIIRKQFEEQLNRL